MDTETKTHSGLLPWHINGCPVCPYAEHTWRPAERCPNDGMPLIRFDGRVSSWQRLADAKRLVAAVIEAVTAESLGTAAMPTEAA